MSESIRVFAPATVANVGSAFDILGFALEAPGDTVIARKTTGKGVFLKNVVSPYGEIPCDSERNTATVAILELLRRKGHEGGIEIELKKNMPLGSGLGSSAASAAAGVFAAKMLLEIDATGSELVECCMEGERIACGSAHADNVAPSLLGGVVLIRSYNPLDIVRIDAPKELYYSIVCPRIEVRTEDARKVLRREVELKKAIQQMGNVAGLIAGFFKGDADLIGRSLEDVLIEPERSALIPGFAEVKRAAFMAGALGCGISGSGPSLFALSRSAEAAGMIAAGMKDAFATIGIDALLFHGQLSPIGARMV